MFWYYGQRILAAARFVRERKNLFLLSLLLTNFSCGPDSFLLTYVDEIMGSKPSLTLELDEHSADTGYGTRLEAFVDLMAEYEEAPKRRTSSMSRTPPGTSTTSESFSFRCTPAWSPCLRPPSRSTGTKP